MQRSEGNGAGSAAGDARRGHGGGGLGRAVGVALLALGAACGGDPGGAPAKAPAPGAAASGAERWFPLEDGRLYHYETVDEVGDTGMLVGTVKRLDPAHGELKMSDVTRRFEYRPDGVYESDGTLVLPAVPEVGRSFMGRKGGGARIVAVGEKVTVPAGRYDDCVVVEERPAVGDALQRTTFCAGVGIVRLEITSEAKRAKVELKSYGFPAKLP